MSALSKLRVEPMLNWRLLETSPGMSCNWPELRSEIARSPAKLNAVMAAKGVPSRSKLKAATSPINGTKSDGVMVPACAVAVRRRAVSGWCTPVPVAAFGAATPDGLGARDCALGTVLPSVAAR